MINILYDIHKGKVSDKWRLYLNEYDRLFSIYKDRLISLLEIGVQNGGSIEIWGKYFVNANILVGCDINPECASLHYEDDRISIVVGDITTSDTKEKILTRCQSYDIIVDDGSHRSPDIIKTFINYFGHLNNGGIYIVEDLHCSYWDIFGGGLSNPQSAISFFKHLIDVINYEHWGSGKRSDMISEYGIDEELLSHIHSIEFVNSICIIKKMTPSKNVLGDRIIVGRDGRICNMTPTK